MLNKASTILLKSSKTSSEGPEIVNPPSITGVWIFSQEN